MCPLHPILSKIHNIGKQGQGCGTPEFASSDMGIIYMSYMLNVKTLAVVVVERRKTMVTQGFYLDVHLIEQAYVYKDIYTPPGTLQKGQQKGKPKFLRRTDIDQRANF